MLGINNDPVTIKAVEVSIIDRAFEEGWVARAAARDAHRPARRGGRLGPGGPGGRGAAQSRRPHGHGVRARRSHRRPAPLRHSRVQDGEAHPRSAAEPADGRRASSSARTPTSASTSPIEELKAQFDAIVLAGGSTRPRDLPVPGRELKGIHFAMEYLTLQNRRNEGDHVPDAEFDLARRASTSSSSAAATPAPTASAPRTARAPPASTSSSCCSRPPDDRGAGQSVAALAEHLPRLVRARGRAASVSTRSPPRSSPATDSGRVTTLHARAVEMVQQGRPDRVRAGAGQRVRAEGRPRAAGDGFRRSGNQRHAVASSA